MNKYYSTLILVILFIVGCSNGPSMGKLMHNQSQRTEDIAKEWDEGNKLINSGSKMYHSGEVLVHKGETKIQEGKQMVEKGKAKIKKGNDTIKTGEQKVFLSENAFDEIYQPEVIVE